jgi:hypothetical protein
MNIHPLQPTLETIEQVFKEIVGDGPRNGSAGHLERDGLGLGGPDENRQRSRVGGPLEQEDESHFGQREM